MAFDSNAMHELAALSRDRYQRAGGGGAHRVHNTSKAYFDARGHGELSPIRRQCVEILHAYRQRVQLINEQYRWQLLTSKGGFYYGDSIPF